MTPGAAAFLIGGFIAAVLTLASIIYWRRHGHWHEGLYITSQFAWGAFFITMGTTTLIDGKGPVWFGPGAIGLGVYYCGYEGWKYWRHRRSVT